MRPGGVVNFREYMYSYMVLGGEPFRCCVKSLRGKAGKGAAVLHMLS